jgi:hypothetical protein
MTPQRRALLCACWLTIAGLLVRIAIARATFSDLDDHPLIVVVGAIGAGLAILGVAVLLVVGFLAGSVFATRASRVAAVATIPFGLFLLIGGHQSGSLIALAAAVGLVASSLQRQRSHRPV